MTTLDQHGHDTELARLLHAKGLVEVTVLQKALEATRREREKGGWTLARALVHHGVLSEDEMSARLSELGGRPDDPLAISIGSASNHGLAPQEPRLSGSTVAGAALGDPTTPAWRKGTRIGELRLVDMIGKGGMGVVYLAENVKTQARYAVKTLGENAPAELIERLKREGEAQASVDAHPNVVRVHALGNAFGRIYLVMDHVTGGTLEHSIRKGPLPGDEAARIVRDLARGLDYMHSKGVLHRDLKPSNVMFDESGTPKLVDFGLALVGSATRLTLSGELLGTPAYMAPEQALGQRDRLGPWTDVYGLGGILYAVLTGYAPYSGDTAVQVVESVIKEPVVPLRARRADVDPGLEAICLHALAKDPKDRPKAADLAAALDAHLEQRGAPRARPVSGAAKALVGLALVSLAALGALVLLARRTAPSRPSSVAAVPSASSPSPARVLPLSLGWKWPESLRVSLTTDVRFVRKFPVEMVFVTHRKLVLVWKPVETEGTRVTASATVESFAARFASEKEIPPGLGEDAEMLKPIDFDSERPDDPQSPFREMIGKSFTFDMDTRTGAITAVKGAHALTEAILAKVEEERRMRFFIPELSTDGSMKTLLDTLLHHGEEGGAVGGRWSLTRPEPPVWGMRQQRGERPPLDVRAKFETKEEPGTRAAIKWSGSGKIDTRERKLEGTATFERGHIVRSEETDDMEAPEGSAHVVYGLEELVGR